MRHCLSLLLLVAPLASACEAGLPATMDAIVIREAGGPEKLALETRPVPQPGPGEVLVRVEYASVNPVDWKLQQWGRLPFPAVPGADLSGEIVSLGEGVTGWDCGDAVIAAVDQVAGQGSYAEYVPVALASMVRKPDSLTHAQAAGLPTTAIAAWRYLATAAALKAGERVLIQGGAGGVGSMALQLAKAKGAYVYATASARNADYLRGLGADVAIDYRAQRFEDVARDVDVVFDTVGGETLERSAAVLRDGGRLVSAAGRTEAFCADGRIACPPTPDWNAQDLLPMLELVERGALAVHVEREWPLARAADAQRESIAGHARGKFVLDVRE